MGIEKNYEVACKNCKYFDDYKGFCELYNIHTRGNGWGCKKYKKRRKII